MIRRALVVTAAAIAVALGTIVLLIGTLTALYMSAAIWVSPGQLDGIHEIAYATGFVALHYLVIFLVYAPIFFLIFGVPALALGVVVVLVILARKRLQSRNAERRGYGPPASP